jgi:hypothetical protein
MGWLPFPSRSWPGKLFAWRAAHSGPDRDHELLFLTDEDGVVESVARDECDSVSAAKSVYRWSEHDRQPESPLDVEVRHLPFFRKASHLSPHSASSAQTSSTPSAARTTTSVARTTSTVNGVIVTEYSYASEDPPPATQTDPTLNEPLDKKDDGDSSKTTTVVLAALGGSAALVIALVVAIRCFFTRRQGRRRLSGSTADWSDRFFAPKPSATVDPFNPEPYSQPRPLSAASDVLQLETAERGAPATRLHGDSPFDLAMR